MDEGAVGGVCWRLEALGSARVRKEGWMRGRWEEESLPVHGEMKRGCHQDGAIDEAKGQSHPEGV
jgi:hypothetical protein